MYCLLKRCFVQANSNDINPAPGNYTLLLGFPDFLILWVLQQNLLTESLKDCSCWVFYSGQFYLQESNSTLYNTKSSQGRFSEWCRFNTVPYLQTQMQRPAAQTVGPPGWFFQSLGEGRFLQEAHSYLSSPGGSDGPKWRGLNGHCSFPQISLHTPVDINSDQLPDLASFASVINFPVVGFAFK